MTFEINADGIVSVRAKDLETGLEQSIQVTATSGLTRDEIKNMIDEREGLHGRAPRRPRSSRRAKQEAEKLIGEIERLFPQVEQIVAVERLRPRRDREGARHRRQGARRRSPKRDVAAVKEQIEGLSRTHRMFKGVVAKTH